MRVHLINPSDTAFGTAVITPRWLFVLAAATPNEFGDPILCDETLEALDLSTIAAGDIVGIGIHTGNALRGYAIGGLAKQRGALVVFGGIHTTLYPEEAFERGAADCVIRGEHIGEFQAIRFYHELYPTLRKDIHPSQRAMILKKAIGRFKAVAPGKLFCKGLVEYYEAL